MAADPRSFPVLTRLLRLGGSRVPAAAHFAVSVLSFFWFHNLLFASCLSVKRPWAASLSSFPHPSLSLTQALSFASDWEAAGSEAWSRTSAFGAELRCRSPPLSFLFTSLLGSRGSSVAPLSRSSPLSSPALSALCAAPPGLSSLKSSPPSSPRPAGSSSSLRTHGPPLGRPSAAAEFAAALGASAVEIPHSASRAREAKPQTRQPSEPVANRRQRTRDASAPSDGPALGAAGAHHPAPRPPGGGLWTGGEAGVRRATRSGSPSSSCRGAVPTDGQCGTPGRPEGHEGGLRGRAGCESEVEQLLRMCEENMREYAQTRGGEAGAEDATEEEASRQRVKEMLERRVALMEAQLVSWKREELRGRHDALQDYLAVLEHTRQRDEACVRQFHAEEINTPDTGSPAELRGSSSSGAAQASRTPPAAASAEAVASDPSACRSAAPAAPGRRPLFPLRGFGGIAVFPLPEARPPGEGREAAADKLPRWRKRLDEERGRRTPATLRPPSYAAIAEQKAEERQALAALKAWKRFHREARQREAAERGAAEPRALGASEETGPVHSGERAEGAPDAVVDAASDAAGRGERTQSAVAPHEEEEGIASRHGLPSASPSADLPSGEFKPKQSLGQNFLSDPNTSRLIAASLEDASPRGVGVVEVGPGTGAITRFLLPKFPRMSAIETDPRALSLLSRRLPSLKLIHGDVLQVSWPALARERGTRLSVVGNLPFYLTSQLLFCFLDAWRFIDQALVTIQWEMAERLTARRGERQYCRLSVVFALYSECKIVKKLPSSVFYPVPKVDAALVHIKFRQAPLTEILQGADPHQFRTVLHAAFGKRRKMLKSSLKEILPHADALPACYARMRPQHLYPTDFLDLTKAIFSPRSFLPASGAEGPKASEEEETEASQAGGPERDDEEDVFAQVGEVSRIWRKEKHGNY
ncbi:dimethyladenosine transferase [Besnoitia besnoiti]|uniref:rRNA adenine N(6)-methyltransferase n=1 Tax=Besnoitia besnoiti TaxID=94643 RepID=A0A2A9MGL0_BESBE|nr:dimethyladenosine transferase [Besnoitia besnoiti]PFH37648.1 dimethyladenosine transferase [Besnoitia besnoiti]